MTRNKHWKKNIALLRSAHVFTGCVAIKQLRSLFSRPLSWLKWAKYWKRRLSQAEAFQVTFQFKRNSGLGEIQEFEVSSRQFSPQTQHKVGWCDVVPINHVEPLEEAELIGHQTNHWVRLNDEGPTEAPHETFTTHLSSPIYSSIRYLMISYDLLRCHDGLRSTNDRPAWSRVQHGLVLASLATSSNLRRRQKMPQPSALLARGRFRKTESCFGKNKKKILPDCIQSKKNVGERIIEILITSCHFM